MTRKETEFRVTLFSKQGAEKWTRHAYGVPADVGLGWTPYRVLVTSARGTLAHTAFLTFKEFKAWMRSKGYALRLQHHGDFFGPQAWVARFGSLYA